MYIDVEYVEFRESDQSNFTFNLKQLKEPPYNNHTIERDTIHLFISFSYAFTTNDFILQNILFIFRQTNHLINSIFSCCICEYIFCLENSFDFMSVYIQFSLLILDTFSPSLYMYSPVTGMLEKISLEINIIFVPMYLHVCSFVIFFVSVNTCTRLNKYIILITSNTKIPLQNKERKKNRFRQQQFTICQQHYIKSVLSVWVRMIPVPDAPSRRPL